MVIGLILQNVVIGHCDDTGPRVWRHHSDNIFLVRTRRYAITVSWKRNIIAVFPP